MHADIASLAGGWLHQPMLCHTSQLTVYRHCCCCCFCCWCQDLEGQLAIVRSALSAEAGRAQRAGEKSGGSGAIKHLTMVPSAASSPWFDSRRGSSIL